MSDEKPEFEEQDWFNSDIFEELKQELFYDVYEWPEGVVTEYAQTSPSDQWFKWSKGITRIKVDGKVAVEMKMGGKHGDTVDEVKIKDKKALADLLGRILATKVGK